MIGALRIIFNKGVSREVNVRLYESVFIPAVTYGCQSWVMKARVKKKISVLEMRVLREIAGVKRVDRVRNTRIRNMCGLRVSLLGLVERRILR